MSSAHACACRYSAPWPLSDRKTTKGVAIRLSVCDGRFTAGFRKRQSGRRNCSAGLRCLLEYLDADDADGREWLRVLDFDLLDRMHHIHTLRHATKHSVLERKRESTYKSASRETERGEHRVRAESASLRARFFCPFFLLPSSSSSSCSARIELTLLSSHGHGTVVMKNCDPLVPGPALAIDSTPGRS